MTTRRCSTTAPSTVSARRWSILPAEKIAVIVLSNADIAGARCKQAERRGARPAAGSRCAAKRFPTRRSSIELPAAALAEMAGDYESTSYWARVEVDGSRLRLTMSGQSIDLTPVEPLKFLAEGRMMFRGSSSNSSARRTAA